MKKLSAGVNSSLLAAVGERLAPAKALVVPDVVPNSKGSKTIFETVYLSILFPSTVEFYSQNISEESYNSSAQNLPCSGTYTKKDNPDKWPEM